MDCDPDKSDGKNNCTQDTQLSVSQMVVLLDNPEDSLSAGVDRIELSMPLDPAIENDGRETFELDGTGHRVLDPSQVAGSPRTWSSASSHSMDTLTQCSQSSDTAPQTDNTASSFPICFTTAPQVTSDWLVSSVPIVPTASPSRHSVTVAPMQLTSAASTTATESAFTTPGTLPRHLDWPLNTMTPGPWIPGEGPPGPNKLTGAQLRSLSAADPLASGSPPDGIDLSDTPPDTHFARPPSTRPALLIPLQELFFMRCTSRPS